MSDLLSAQLLKEINEDLSSSSEDEQISLNEIEVKFVVIPGSVEGSNLIWAFEEMNLYYKNSYSKVTGIEACKCRKPGCKARLYIRENGTAFRKAGIEHSKNHGSMYTDFKYAYCFNKMKEKAKTASASTTTFQIYTDVVIE